MAGPAGTSDLDSPTILNLDPGPRLTKRTSEAKESATF